METSRVHMIKVDMIKVRATGTRVSMDTLEVTIKANMAGITKLVMIKSRRTELRAVQSVS